MSLTVSDHVHMPHYTTNCLIKSPIKPLQTYLKINKKEMKNTIRKK